MSTKTKAAAPAATKTAAKKPYIGMTCIFQAAGKGANSQPFPPLAAIVVDVLDEGAVNLQVFHRADEGSALKQNVPQQVKGSEVDSWTFCAE